MTLTKTKVALAAAGIFALGAAGGRFTSALLGHDAEAATPIATAGALLPASLPLPVSPGAAPDYRAIVAQGGPAVVGITIDGERKVSNDDDSADPFGDDPFFQFFRGLPMPMPRGRVPIHGQGSGFIVSSDGLILTNAHVVRDAKRVTVKLADRREFKAKVLGSDPATDIALIKIDAKGLPTVRLGDSDKLAVGDYVLAIGAPYGFEQSATAGIVSAKGRSLPGDSAVPFIQTDVAVNPGNSGGPLFDGSGAVVGINSQIYSNTGGYEGLSFAVPIDVALQVKDQILKHGKVEHARLGVTVQALNQSLAESFGLKTPDGALVSKVEPDSAAARAGIESGDVILSFNGETVRDSGQLASRVSMAAPGDKAKVELWRDGKKKELDVKLGSAGEDLASDGSTPSAARGRLGLAVRPLTPDESRQLGTSGGLAVQRVSGPAAQAGIRPGDIVLSVNGQSVHSVEQLRDAVGKRDTVALLIQRGDARIFVPVELG